MVDIPVILKKHREQEALRRLQDLQNLMAANNRRLEDEAVKDLLNSLNKQSGLKRNEKFSRENMDLLRRFTEMGGNRAR